MGSEGPPRKRPRSAEGAPTGAAAGLLASLEELLEERIGRAVAEHLGRAGGAPAGARQEGPAARVEERLARLERELEALRGELRRPKGPPQAGAAVGKAAAAPAVDQLGGKLTGKLILKVGSKKFQTTAETLRAVPDSFFDSMVSGRVPQRREKDGSIFIDRNPKHFQHVLDFLRCAGEGFTPPASKTAQDELRAEADFYGLRGLVMMLRRMCVMSNHLMTVGKKGSVLSGNQYAAAMLDVRDPNDFAVTFALGGFSPREVRSPYLVGVAPADVDLKQDWPSFASPQPALPALSDLRISGATGVQRLGQDGPREERFPPAIQAGMLVACPRRSLVLAQDAVDFQARCECLQFITDKARLCGSSWRPERYPKPTLIRLHLVRSAEGCTVEFRLERAHGAQAWKFDLSKHGLDGRADFRPVIFFTQRGVTATIEELVA